MPHGRCEPRREIHSLGRMPDQNNKRLFLLQNRPEDRDIRIRAVLGQILMFGDHDPVDLFRFKLVHQRSGARSQQNGRNRLAKVAAEPLSKNE